MFRMVFRLAVPIILALIPGVVFAQSISVTLTPQTVGDADEYFTDTQQATRNFNSNCDIGYDSWLFSPEAITSGTWNGVNPSSSAPLFSPLPVAFPGTLDVTIHDCYKQGNHYPIDANKYTHISWRQYSSSPGSFNFLWSQNNDVPASGWSDYDGYFLPGAGAPTAPYTWSIKDKYLPSVSASPSWGGSISGLTLRPSTSTGPGGSTGMDFMRIIDPNTSPTVSIYWGTTGGGSNDYVHLYVDRDGSGFDGDLAAKQLSKNGSLDYKTGLLPPGTYYFYATYVTTDGHTEQVLATSSYAGPITINGKPTLSFTSPSRLNVNNSAYQPEYFRDEVGNEADFSDSADVKNFNDPDNGATKGWHNGQIAGGLFIAESDADPVGGQVDTQVILNVPSNKPINTSDYRYLCHKIQLDSTNMPRNGGASELNDAGWVMRAVWAKTNTNYEGRSNDHFMIEKSTTFPSSSNSYTKEGFTTYCLDLWDNATLEVIGGLPAEKNSHWLEMGTVTVLRHDPIEATPATKFALDHVWLLAENRVNSEKQFKIDWEAADPEGDSLTISLYYDNDNSGYNGTLITTLSGQSAGAGTYTWDASAVADGSYYIYSVINDGTNSNRSYSRVAVNVGTFSAVGASKRTPLDYDGDAKSDFVVVRNSTWYQYFNASGQTNTEVWGDKNQDFFIDYDRDGDRQADVSFARALTANPWIYWYSILSANTTTNSDIWGQVGDVPVVGDFDGDAKDDLVLFRKSDSTWWSIQTTDGAKSFQWGLNHLFGDLPVPEDFDGDGKTDYAVFRNDFGYWAALLSSTNYSRELENIVWKQWGLPGDHPMPGDYDGDGKADLVVWRENIAFWWICHSSLNYDCTNYSYHQFGLPGDYPIKGDFDGDGKLDPAVFRPSDGTWYWKRSSDGQIGSKQWGMNGDVPLGQGIKDMMDLLPN